MLVKVLDFVLDAHLAAVAVEEVVAAAQLAYTAVTAVEYLFARFVVIELADLAVVLAEDDFALLTCLLGRLDGRAVVALDLFDLFRVESVRLPWLLLLLLFPPAKSRLA